MCEVCKICGQKISENDLKIMVPNVGYVCSEKCFDIAINKSLHDEAHKTVPKNETILFG